MKEYKTPRGTPKFITKEYKGGAKEYFMNGFYHRLDCPAISDPENIESSWWIEGNIIDCSSQEQFESSKEFKEWKLKVFS